MSLSVIIVSYNTKQLLSDCLKSVYKSQSPKDGLEVIVVDNNSPDDSVQMVEADFPQVKLIANQDNKGFAAANNQAAAIAQGKYLLFLNSDTKLTPHALVKPLKYLRTHQDVGAITVKLLLPTGQIDLDNHRGFPTPWTALTKMLRLNTLFPNSRLFNNYYQSYKGYDRIHSIDVAAGSYIMLSKKLFDKIGGWDESYFFYGEDIDLCYRIRQTGKKIIYYPKVTTIHYKGASSGLRKESADKARPPKATRIKVAKASTQAMKIFYRKFYQNQYPFFITYPILLAITLLGWLRVIKHQLT